LIDFISLDRRRPARATAVVIGLALCATVAHAATRVLLHASLLRSTPAANSHLAKAPDAIRLVFSEQIVPELSQIALIRPDGSSSQLQVANDPHDVHTLVGRIAALPELTSGRYTVSWRVISADGHPVGGSFIFSVGNPAADTARPTVVGPSSRGAAKPSGDSLAVGGVGSPASVSAPEQKSVPILASLLRGLGLGALMAGVGLLFFGVTSGEHRHFSPRAFIVRAIAVGAVLLVAHFFAWLRYLSPTGGLNGDFMGAMFDSSVGRVEVIRTLLAVLTLWAIALARRDKIALALGAACLVVSGAIGHPAAIDPYWTIPAKSLHLLAAAVWLGGLFWLVWLSRCDDAACQAEARRVSSLALVSVIVIFLSGLLETVFFLNTPADLVRSDYGRLVLAKMVGLGILIAYGSYNRFRLLPQLDAPSAKKLSRSVKQEIVVVTLVILIGGFLAYVPTPPLGRSAAATTVSSQ
jgi:copper transport protein